MTNPCGKETHEHSVGSDVIHSVICACIYYLKLSMKGVESSSRPGLNFIALL